MNKNGERLANCLNVNKLTLTNKFQTPQEKHVYMTVTRGPVTRTKSITLRLTKYGSLVYWMLGADGADGDFDHNLDIANT